ncbi:hypothetical protein Tco_0612317 [Tanacetum coccineum]
MKPIIIPSSYQPKKTHKPRTAIRTTEISQYSGPMKLFADETIYKEWEDRMERAATTASSLDAEQDNAKAKMINGECQLQALVDKKNVIITETSIRIDLHLEDAGGIDCLPTDTIFEELAKVGPQKKQSRRKQRKETEVPQVETHHDDSVPIPSNDPLLSGEDRMQLTELMILCTNLQKQVLDLERQRMLKQRRLKVDESRRVESSEDKDSLGAQEDASKQRTSFEDIDKDAEVSLVDETHRRLDDAKMFDTDDLHGDEVIVDMAVGEKQEQSAKVDEREVSTSVEDSVAPIILVSTAGEGVTATKINEITTTTVTTAATTKTTTRPKARGVVVQEPSEFRTTTSSPQASQPSKTKDKGKAIMIEPEVPLKKKDQVALDEEMARNLEAQLQAELIEEERLARKKEEEANIALIESWENTQAMMEADRLLAERLQTREQEELTDEEKAKLFMEFIEKRRKHFAALRAQEKRKRDLTKTQKVEIKMSIYLKAYSGKKDENSSKKAEITQDSSAKRAGDKLESDKSKKQKSDENKEVEVDNEAKLKKHMVTVKDDDIAIDVKPLATKPPVIGIDREDFTAGTKVNAAGLQLLEELLLSEG